MNHRISSDDNISCKVCEENYVSINGKCIKLSSYFRERCIKLKNNKFNSINNLECEVCAEFFIPINFIY